MKRNLAFVFAFALEFAAVERSEQNALTLRFGRPRLPKEPR